ncbi:methyltransferase [Verrucomicrobiota bacterium sgz303538]
MEHFLAYFPQHGPELAAHARSAYVPMTIAMTDDYSVHLNASDLAIRLLENVRGSTPLGIEQIDILLRLVSAARETVGNFLCLGADLGVLAAAILEEHPHARGLVIDDSAAALDVAKRQLQAHQRNVRFQQISPDDAEWNEIADTAAPFDAVILGPSLTITGTRKRPLFADAYQLLVPGGILLDVENVASATRWSESVLDDYLIDAIFGEALREGAGKSRADVAREHFAREKEHAGTIVPLEVQCDWLREIGFESVDCYSKVAELAVFGGQRPAA